MWHFSSRRNHFQLYYDFFKIAHVSQAIFDKPYNLQVFMLYVSVAQILVYITARLQRDS